MSKYEYHMGVDIASGNDYTVFSCFRQRRVRWWERIVMRVFKGYKIKQPFELLSQFIPANNKTTSHEPKDTHDKSIHSVL